MVAEIIAFLYITVGGVGAVRRHAHGQEAIVGANVVQSLGDFLCEDLFAGDELVGRCGNETSFGIATGDAPSGPCGSRCGRELRGFGENILRRKLWKLFANGVNVFGEGGNIDVFDREEGGISIENFLMQ